MSRADTNRIDIDQELIMAVQMASGRYQNRHSKLSNDRRKDVDSLRQILADSSRLAICKHAAISRYIRSLKRGLLGRSDLADYVWQALESVSIECLVQDLLARHKAELRAKDMALHALQPISSDPVTHDLLLAAKTAELSKSQEHARHLNQKMARLVTVEQQLISKYKSLKQEHMKLCRKYGEQHAFSSETLSQPSSSVAIPEEEITDDVLALSLTMS